MAITLTAAIGAFDAFIPASAGLRASPGDLVQIDSERLTVIDSSALWWSVVRGADFTSPSPHNQGTSIAAVSSGGGSQTLDQTLALSSGEDISDALTGAASPAAGNVFATIADLPVGGSISVSDGSTTVNPATSVVFTGATVSDAGGGEADVAIAGGSQDLATTLGVGNTTGENTIVTPMGTIDGTTANGNLDLYGLNNGNATGSDISAGSASGLDGGGAQVLAGDGDTGGGGGNATLTGGRGDGGGSHGAFIRANGGNLIGGGGGADLVGGAAKTSSGAAGGDITLTPGAGDGAGRGGLVILTLSALPSADPLVAGAVYSDGAPGAGSPVALKISGG